MTLFSVLVFEGGSIPDSEDEVTMSEWTVAEARCVFGEFMGNTELWANEKIEWADPSGPQTLNDTIEVVNDRLMTAMVSGGDGGQLYLVKVTS